MYIEELLLPYRLCSICLMQFVTGLVSVAKVAACRKSRIIGDL